MRHRDVRPITQHRREQLDGTPQGASHFHQLVRPVVSAYDAEGKPVTVCELAGLKGIPRGYRYRVSRTFELPDDRREEWNVRRVVEVDPYSLGSDPGWSSR